MGLLSKRPCDSGKVTDDGCGLSNPLFENQAQGILSIVRNFPLNKLTVYVFLYKLETGKRCD